MASAKTIGFKPIAFQGRQSRETLLSFPALFLGADDNYKSTV